MMARPGNSEGILSGGNLWSFWTGRLRVGQLVGLWPLDLIALWCLLGLLTAIGIVRVRWELDDTSGEGAEASLWIYGQSLPRLALVALVSVALCPLQIATTSISAISGVCQHIGGHS
jgi:hypothetical protein